MWDFSSTTSCLFNIIVLIVVAAIFFKTPDNIFTEHAYKKYGYSKEKVSRFLGAFFIAMAVAIIPTMYAAECRERAWLYGVSIVLVIITVIGFILWYKSGKLK